MPGTLRSGGAARGRGSGPVAGESERFGESTGARLAAFAAEERSARAVLMLSGVLDERSGGVLREARGRCARDPAIVDLGGVRAWTVRGLAGLLEAFADVPDLTLDGASGTLAACLADARPDWDVRGKDGTAPARPAQTWFRDHLDALTQVADRVLALLFLLLALPWLLAIAAAIAIDSPGGVIYSQLRSGRLRRDGTIHVFRVFKFRTMGARADEMRAQLMAGERTGPFFKLEGDPRVTRIGRILRATSLDELPQLLNVLRGEMRLVGNRPLALDEAAGLADPWERVRFRAPAGLTGLWQVSGRSEVTPTARLALDTAYAATRSPLLDLRILLLTVPAVLLRKGW